MRGCPLPPAALDPRVLPISQGEFAEIADLSRNAAGDALRALAQAGVIRLGHREIEVLDVAQLN
ncbi:MAG: hypothetical protein CML66_09105 [Rhodobacteraceae bacterium]|nr:hypothetical protein [Paracoccaceae bacterium]MAY46802.1 hypothetical protein [Paracoccaceae bacterium]